MACGIAPAGLIRRQLETLARMPLPGALVAEVGAPGPGGDDHVDRGRIGVEPHLAVAAEGERADVAGGLPVAAHQLVRGQAQFLRRVGQFQVVELGRLGEPVEVLLGAEDGRAALGLVGADALEDAGSVVQPVRQHVHLRVVPGDKFAVLPNQIAGIHVGGIMPDGSKGLKPSSSNDGLKPEKGGSRMKRFRPRLTYANVIASLALFVALGGAARGGRTAPRTASARTS